jgi:hypothetical protein
MKRIILTLTAGGVNQHMLSILRLIGVVHLSHRRVFSGK